MSKQALNPNKQRSPTCRDCELGYDDTHLLECRKSSGVGQYVSTSGYGEVVAAMLPLMPDLPGDPPHRGVIEEQGLNRCLNKIDQIVTSADMSNFMSQQSFQLLRAQS
jgi:hypothetical protein